MHSGAHDVADRARRILRAGDGDEATVTRSAEGEPDLVGAGTVRSSRPNGEGCGPVCTLAEVSLDAG